MKQSDAAEILIVDRQIVSQRLLAGILQKEGYRTKSVDSGEQALELVLAEPPDLVLLDANLPGIDGYEVCQRLKSEARTSQIPVLFMSSSYSVFDKVKAFQVRGVDYITKPFEVMELVARLAVQIRLRNQRLELQQKNAQLKGLLHTVSHDLRNPIVGLGMTLGSFLLQDQSQFVLARKMLERMWNGSGVAIALGANYDGQRVQCTVTDNGVGIPRRVKQRLFAPYASGNSFTQGNVGAGMGLGLHICRQIIETHGGQIGVESQPGEGATFWFALPLRLNQPQTPRFEGGANAIVNGKFGKYLPDVSLNGIGA